MNHWVAALLAVATVAFGCGNRDAGSESSPPDSSAAADAPPAGRLAPLMSPTAWEGEIPCADCSGIRVTLLLEPDGSYRKRSTYLGVSPPSDSLFMDFGRWFLSSEADRIVLHGTGGSMEYWSPRVDSSLRILDASGEELDSVLNYTLMPLRSVPPLDGVVTLLGAFTYLADAPGLVECSSGIRMPVEQTEPYLALERAYLAAGASGAPMTVRTRGSLAERTAMDGGGSETAFVVQSFEGEASGEPCEATEVEEALASGEWRLAAVDGAPLEAGAVGQVPTMTWDPAEPRLAGSAGCNQYTTRAFLRGTLLVTEAPVSTRMFCEGAMDLETRFLAIVSSGGVLRLDRESLVWYDGPYEVARFVRS
jgi:copper homeostasis protein (lipoprotein)